LNTCRLYPGPYLGDEGDFGWAFVSRSVLIEELSTLKEERQNSYIHSLKIDGVKVGPQVDFLLFQPEL